jgi:hypothetical protein
MDLIDSARNGDEALCARLINADHASVLFTDSTGRSALHYAVKSRLERAGLRQSVS